LLAAVCLAVLGALTLAQPAQAQHHGLGHGGFGGPDRGFPRPEAGPPPDVHEPGTESTMRRGLQLGPPGRWWDDKHFAKQVQLRPDQQRRMDSIFEQNRTVLLKRYESLEQEEQKMLTLTQARTLDENALFAQIDRVEQARADLEKANTHLLFQIRSEMDTDQVSRLDEHR
jgi:Spy/CpxP family protein refolding chaperone